MKFLVDYGSKKSQENLLKKPPIFQKKMKFLLYFAGAQAAAIKYRIAERGIAADGSKIKRYNNSGGMWSGWNGRIVGKMARIEFLKTSLPSSAAKLLEKKFETEKERQKYIKKLRQDKKLKKIRNRLKAKTCALSKSAGARKFHEPSIDEVKALRTWLQEHLERNLLAVVGKDFRHKAIPDRFNNILKRLPDPKSKG